MGVVEVQSDGVKSEGFFVELDLKLLEGGLKLLESGLELIVGGKLVIDDVDLCLG